MSHELVDLCLDVHLGTLGQMYIDKCRANTLVTQQRLNYAQMNTGLQKMSGVRMPQCVTVYVLAYIRPPEGCCETALHAAFGDG
jgi:hypothetical protein